MPTLTRENLRAQMDGCLASVEFVQKDDDDGRLPGTYITIHLDGDPAIAAGRVRVTYLCEHKFGDGIARPEGGYSAVCQKCGFVGSTDR